MAATLFSLFFSFLLSALTRAAARSAKDLAAVSVAAVCPAAVSVAARLVAAFSYKRGAEREGGIIVRHL